MKNYYKEEESNRTMNLRTGLHPAIRCTVYASLSVGKNDVG